MTDTRGITWRQLTLGHLSRNKFWGEDPDTQYHSVVASTTLVRAGDTNILVDPTLPAEELERRLQRYCGLGRRDIDIVFATHYHTDHRVDAEQYPNARLYMSAGSIQDIAEVKREGGFFARAFLNGAVFDFEPAPRRLAPGVEVVPLPGHTPGLAGLLFVSGGKRVLLAGDTIMNPEFYKAREGYFIDASQQKTAASMAWASQNADIIVPGHGDWFFADEGEKTLAWRRLNLCAAGEEAAVLVRAGGENILVNPVLPGHLLREALYDAWGLEPSAITRVLCLKNDPRHALDLPVMKNAQLYLPAWELKAGAADEQAPSHRLHFSAWETSPQLPLELVQAGSATACLFASGGRTVAVAGEACGEEALRERGASLAVLGGEVRFW